MFVIFWLSLLFTLTLVSCWQFEHVFKHVADLQCASSMLERARWWRWVGWALIKVSIVDWKCYWWPPHSSQAALSSCPTCWALPPDHFPPPGTPVVVDTFSILMYWSTSLLYGWFVIVVHSKVQVSMTYIYSPCPPNTRNGASVLKLPFLPWVKFVS